MTTLAVLLASCVGSGSVALLRADAAPQKPKVPHAQNVSIPKISEKVADVAGTLHLIPAPGQKATALVFISHDCPISNSYAPEISRIAREYSSRGVQLLVVYAESGLSPAQAREHARQYGYQVPLIIDAQHRLSRAVGATITPEVAVVAPDGKRLYLGRIDNLYADFGKKRRQATERDLRVALESALAHKPIPHPTTQAVGCFIPTS